MKINESKVKNRKTPKLRFSGFTHLWSEEKLGDLFIERNERKGSQDLELLSVTTNNGITKQTSSNKRDNSSADKSGYKIVYKKDIVYNTMRMWQGASGVSPYNGFVSPAYTVIYLKNGNVDFYRYLFKKPRVIFNFYRYSQGLTSDTWNLKFHHFSKVIVVVPSSEDEQKKISNFLHLVDQWIENLKEQRKLLEIYKKSLTQKIFSQAIRFKKSTQDSFPEWSEKKLVDILDYEQPTKYIVETKDYNNKYKTPVLTAGKTFILGYTNEPINIFDSNNLPVIIFDDFTTATKFVDFPFKVKSSAMKILKNKNNEISDISFVFLAINRIRFALGDEHKRFWISEYSKIKIPFPSIDEQKKIALLFNSVDSLISLNIDKIIQAEKWKRGLIQGLFI